MRIVKLIALLLLILPLNMAAQHEKDADQEKYEWRLRQEVLYGTYIPRDVNDVFNELNKKIDEPSKAKFKSLPEDAAASKLFFSLGKWMTHNWGLYEGSRLSKHMQDLGVYHPDDMVRFLIVAYHRSLNRKPLDIKDLLKSYHEKNEQMLQQRILDGQIIYEQTRKVDTIPPPKRNQP